MKKKIAVLLMAILALSLLISGCTAKQTSGGEDQSLKEIKEKGELVLGLDDSFPPMGFRDAKGEIVGFDIDLAKAVAEKMGVKLVLKPVDWDGVLLSLKNKDIDVIWNGLTITEARKKEIAFSKPYLENQQIIVINHDAAIKDKTDLEGKTVGIQLGSSSEEALSADAKTEKSLKEIRKFSNNVEALLDLEAKRVDAVIVDEVVGRYYTAKKPGQFKILEDNFGQEAYGIGIRKGDESFRVEIDKILDELRANGTTEKISKKWFGEDIINK